MVAIALTPTAVSFMIGPTTVSAPSGEVVPIPTLPLLPKMVRADIVVVAVPVTVVVDK